MKKSWIVRMDEKAVSPVIATILMVAITVVLAAVLYVMVTGLIGGGGSTIAPSVTFTTDNPGTGVWTARVAEVSRAETLGKFQVSLVNRTTGAAVACGNQLDLSDTVSISCTQGASPVTLTFSDLASNTANQLNGGDELAVSGIASATTYTVNLIWKQSGSIIRSVTLP